MLILAILAILAIGIVAGWLAQLILGRRTSNRCEALVAGLVGSFVGGLLASLIAGSGFAIRPSGIIGSAVGAIIVLVVWNWIRPRRQMPTTPPR